MGASSTTRRTVARLVVRDWAWWQLPALLRAYVALVPLAAVALTCFAASQTTWHVSDLLKFCLRIAYTQGALVRDFITVWVLPVAILLPPVYAMVAPIPLLMLTQWVIHRGVVYRRVFTAAAIGLSYGGASLVFRAFPHSFAGGAIGAGTHALTWALAVAACEIVGRNGHATLRGMKLI